jgi:hypothetical protein
VEVDPSRADVTYDRRTFHMLTRIPPAALGLLGALALCLPAAPRAHADLTQPLALADLTRAAGTIVVGRVVAVRAGSHPRYRHVPVTFVTVRVAETWKGQPGRTLTFMQFGHAAATELPLAHTPGRMAIARLGDLPTYAEGEEILLFLRRPSHAGLTSPVGGLTGRLGVLREAGTGRETVRGGLADLSPATSRSLRSQLQAPGAKRQAGPGAWSLAPGAGTGRRADSVGGGEVALAVVREYVLRIARLEDQNR